MHFAVLATGDALLIVDIRMLVIGFGERPFRQCDILGVKRAVEGGALARHGLGGRHVLGDVVTDKGRETLAGTCPERGNHAHRDDGKSELSHV